MNSHSVFMAQGVGSPHRDGGSPRLLETLTSTTEAFTPLTSSFHPQTTTYYSTPTTYHMSSSFSQDKDYSVHGMNPVRLPALSASLSGVSDLLSSSITKEHPAAVQADQMNSYMEFFVDPEQGSSRQDHPGQVVGGEVIVDDHIVDVLGKDVILMENEDGESLMGDEHLEEDDDDHHDDELDEMGYPRMDDSVAAQREELLKRKRQMERERRELDAMMRTPGDMEDGEMVARIRNESAKARRAEAARSRYQRMSEAERKAYNQRRRLKALGLDPDQSKEGQTSEEAIKSSIRMANAKKAEAARLRYHRMTPEEKKEYNQRRTESFRKRREEEEILLSTPAGCISADALAKAQQIMIRNARKAQAARERYQRMTPDQRKEYNIRRAQTKKCKNQAMNAALASHQGSSRASDLDDDDDDFAANESFDNSALSLGSSFSSEPPVNILEGVRSESIPAPPIQPRNPSDEIFEQMERDVIKRTKQAQMIITRQRDQASQQRGFSQGDGIGPDGVPMDGHLMQEKGYSNQMATMIDEKMLQEMLLTGRDVNGMPVELRTIDGLRITEQHQLRALSQGQTIVITPLEAAMHIDSKDNVFVQADGHLVPSTSGQEAMYGAHDYTNGAHGQQMADAHLISLAERHQVSKQKRAERARARYRNMQPELRQAQNSRRAELLRKSRARDEELVQMADRTDISAMTPEVQRAVQEAQLRRQRRAEQARSKYHRMSSEERRQYNAMRDAQRRQRKRQRDMNREEERTATEQQTLDMDDHHLSVGPSATNSLSPQNGDTVEERIIYGGYDMYNEQMDPMPTWDQ